MIAFYPIVVGLVALGALGAGRPAGRARAPAARPVLKAYSRAEARRAAARLSHLAAVVRGARLLPQQAGGRPVRARAGGEPRPRSLSWTLSDAAGRGCAARRCCAAPRSCRRRSSSSDRRGTAAPSVRSNGACSSHMSVAYGPRISIAVSENSCTRLVPISFMAADRCGFSALVQRVGERPHARRSA